MNEDNQTKHNNSKSQLDIYNVSHQWLDKNIAAFISFH